jgi:hypothetical protein
VHAAIGIKNSKIVDFDAKMEVESPVTGGPTRPGECPKYDIFTIDVRRRRSK